MAGDPVPAIRDCHDLALVGERLASTLFAAHHEHIGQPVTVTVYPALRAASWRADSKRHR